VGRGGKWNWGLLLVLLLWYRQLVSCLDMDMEMDIEMEMDMDMEAVAFY
jgi:hypothetical protein